jgi:zinc transporter, ZIP family
VSAGEPVDLIVVFVAALVTALATGLGALPLAVAPRLAGATVGLANAAAAGCMVAASGLLLWEGFAVDGWGTVAGVGAGLAFTALAARAIARRPDVRFEALGSADARKALLIVGVMTVHSVAEGIGVGVSFADTQSLGLVTALAIAVHNIPEGLAISLVLVPRGVRVLHAAGWSIVSSLPQPLLAVPAFAFVAAFSGLLPVGLGFAAGAMLWMVAAELLPDAFRAAPVGRVLVAGAIATGALVAFQAVILAA